MTLRLRLALVLVLAAVPLVLGLAWVRQDLERRAAEQGLVEFVYARMEGGGRAECEASPETFPREPRGREGPPPPGRPRRGPGPAPGEGQPPRERYFPEGDRSPDPFPRGRPPAPRGPPGPAGPPGAPPRIELWAYTSVFVSANPAAPPFPPELRRGLEAGSDVSSGPFASGQRAGMQVAVRMGWTEGPCAVVIARRLDLGPPRAAAEVFSGAAILCAGLLAAVLLAVGPIVRRIRRLTSEVRRSARDRYETPVAVSGGDEISELAMAFNEAGAELRAHLASLERREATLRAFVANTTHDVATPLTVLAGHLASLRRQAESGVAADRGRVRDALEEAHYMASLLHNLGAAAKLEAGAPSLVSAVVDAGRLVERAVGRHRPIAAERRIALDFAVPERPLRIAGDETLLEQAVSNVIQNAVRYNDPGGHVAVVLEERHGGRGFSLRIVDDGPGVSEEELARLGERSFRGDAARTRHPGGKGLGLGIARDVALRHGFPLELRRVEPHGLEVELSGRTAAAETTAGERPAAV